METGNVSFHGHVKPLFRGMAGLLMLAVLVGCNQAPAGPRVSFAEPQNGATVRSPVKLRMSAVNFTVEPAGEVRAGAGHLHVVVDGPCVEAGQIIPKDDVHLHFGNGQVEAEINLTLGAHTLCLQAADGAHLALAGNGLAQTINITVQ